MTLELIRRTWPVFLFALVVIVLSTLVSGCATAPPAPVIVRCTPNVGADPAYPDTDAALAAGDIVPDVQMLMAGRALRDARILTLKAALTACAG